VGDGRWRGRVFYREISGSNSFACLTQKITICCRYCFEFNSFANYHVPMSFTHLNIIQNNCKLLKKKLKPDMVASLLTWSAGLRVREGGGGSGV
jgi:hypothetical protein